MAKQRHTTEELIHKLRENDIAAIKWEASLHTWAARVALLFTLDGMLLRPPQGAGA